jgi:exodeoxyribonuclease VII small subunit
MNKKELTYDQAFEELQTILDTIEQEDTGIDVLEAKVKRAAELIKYCKNKLKATEQEVEKALKEIG